MAITIKKKEAVPVLEGLPADDMTQRQLDALAAVGLAPEAPKAPPPPTVHKPGITIKKLGSFAEGDAVTITNNLYSWVEWWKPGDTGKVLKVYSQSTILKPEERKRYTVVQVKLDKVRVHGREICLFHAWELEVTKKGGL